MRERRPPFYGVLDFDFRRKYYFTKDTTKYAGETGALRGNCRRCVSRAVLCAQETNSVRLKGLPNHGVNREKPTPSTPTLPAGLAGGPTSSHAGLPLGPLDASETLGASGPRLRRRDGSSCTRTLFLTGPPL